MSVSKINKQDKKQRNGVNDIFASENMEKYVTHIPDVVSYIQNLRMAYFTYTHVYVIKHYILFHFKFLGTFCCPPPPIPNSINTPSEKIIKHSIDMFKPTRNFLFIS